MRASRTPSTLASSEESFRASPTSTERRGLSPESPPRPSHAAGRRVGEGARPAIGCVDARLQIGVATNASTNAANERTPLAKDVIARAPEGLPRIKTKTRTDEMLEKNNHGERRFSFVGWRDFCPGIVSIAVAFFLFSAANVVWKSGKAAGWYDQFRGHARYFGPAACFRDAKLSEEHCLPHFAIIGASTSTGRLKAALKEHPMIDSNTKEVHFWNTPYGTRASGGEMCEGHQSERGAAMLKAYVDALVPKRVKEGEWDSRDVIPTGTSYDKDKHKGMVYGDWSDTSFSCSCCAKAMRNTLPRLRPIVVLSEPIERAMKRYAMENVDIHSDDTNAANYGGFGACAKTSKSSVQAFKKMKKDLNKCGGFSRSNEDSLSQCLDAHPVLGASRYDHYLSLWKDAFPDLLVLFDKDFSTKENLEATTRRVEDYLGLNEHDEYDFTQIWNAIEGLENNAKRKLYNNETKTAIHDELHDDIRLSAIKNLREMAKHHDAPEIPSEWVEKYSDPLQHEETTKTDQVVSSEVDASKSSRRMLKEWTPKTARGKFYGQASSFSAFDVDPKILAELKDESNKDSQFAFVPVLHKQNALRVANQFRANGEWITELGLTESQKATTFRELWREDCTHAQQWDASVGCCGESCCFDDDDDDDIAAAVTKDSSHDHE